MSARSASATGLFRRIWMSAAGVCLRQRRPRQRVTGASRPCRAPQGSRRARSAGGCGSWPPPMGSIWVGCVVLAGGGKQRVTQDATLVADLLSMVEPDARGDPMSPLRWTCKSVSQLTRALVAKSHRVGRTLVGELLHQQRFSLQANRKTREGEGHPDRDAQFHHLNESVRAALAVGEPVSRSIRRRRSSSAISRTPAGNGVLGASPRTCGCMTS